ncbi:MAG: tRNA (guanosine(46)-N7)-methyltransferase TrmB [Puniceicoccaceae bacterium]|nr:MAG: tRNA (guanosine(46)-N7)-methyltransferase TrmB [Puniceicoccaceae bacterium]
MKTEAIPSFTSNRPRLKRSSFVMKRWRVARSRRSVTTGNSGGEDTTGGGTRSCISVSPALVMAEISEAHARELAKQAARKEDLSRSVVADLSGCQRILFEAGCGHGHWLCDFAAAHPDIHCVGIDLISWRIRKANDKKAKRDLGNLHFYKAELAEFLEVLPPAIRFERTVLLFPDPWPKAKHHRRRMVQAAFLDEVARRSDPGGEFCFRTDDRPYFDWTLEHLEAHPEWMIDEAAPWPYESETYFQSLMSSFDSVVAKRV